MNQSSKLDDYCKSRLLSYEIEDNCLSLNGLHYHIVADDQSTLFDDKFRFIPNEAAKFEDGYVFEFGGRWYVQRKNEEVDLTELKYIGKAHQQLPTNSFLGIRSSYELMNGLGLYADWVAKAKFLGITSLGICEKSTLSGVLVFQNECQKNQIKPIIGMTIPVMGEEVYDIKVYVREFQGWLNLLKFNFILNVEDKKYIEEDFLIRHKEGLFLVADPKSINFGTSEIFCHIDYYQLDTTRFLNEEKDSWYINNLGNFIQSNVRPISIVDAFYLEQEDYLTREVVWTMGKSFDEKTDNQFFKSSDQYVTELKSLFEDSNKSWQNLYHHASRNEKLLIDSCNFVYDTGSRHLPKYVMTKSESSKFETNEKLFFSLIKQGLLDRGLVQQQYIDRLKEEIEVLRKGDIIDYFLVLYDIIREARLQGCLTGIGRGSVGGSLIAYLLGIVHIDPLEFDLLFERFLNSGRMGKYVDKPVFNLALEGGGYLSLPEGSIVKIEREGIRKTIPINEIREGDDLINS